MGNPFRFRGQRKGEIGGYVTGWWYMSTITEGQDVIRDEDGLAWCVKRESLSISTGKLDSTGTEIFASFPIDGVMTEGGDVVQAPREAIFPVRYSQSAGGFVVVQSSGREHLIGSLDIETYTIIGKGGGSDK